MKTDSVFSSEVQKKRIKELRQKRREREVSGDGQSLLRQLFDDVCAERDGLERKVEDLKHQLACKGEINEAQHRNILKLCKDAERTQKQVNTARAAKPAIKAILEIISSKRDASGNKYWAFNLVDTVSGKELSVKCPHSDESNILTAVRACYGDGRRETIGYFYKEYPIRIFKNYMDSKNQGWIDYDCGTVSELTAAIQAWRATL